MRRITLFIIHCSATRCGQPYSFEDCRRDHIDGRHFRDIGYHYYITRDGRVHPGRPLSLEGAHCFGHNRHSIGICYEGGLDGKGLARHSHACPEGCPHAVVARAGPPLPGSSHRRTPRLEPPKGLSFVRRSERIQERRTPWEALRPPRECVSFTRCCYCARFPLFLNSRINRLDFQRFQIIFCPRITYILIDHATSIAGNSCFGNRPQDVMHTHAIFAVRNFNSFVEEVVMNHHPVEIEVYAGIFAVRSDTTRS